jgi:SAM-dependent methyltransferase
MPSTSRRLEEVYSEQAFTPGHTEHWSGPPEMVEKIAQVVGTKEGDAVLDVGAGIGGPARRLSEIVGCRVVGVDPVESVVQAAVERSATDRVRFIVGSASSLPFRSETFDQVWSLGVISHIPHITLFCREIDRVSTSDAVAVFTEAFWRGYETPQFQDNAPAPWKPTTLKAFTDALAQTGMGSVEVLDWPGAGLMSFHEVTDPALRADLLDGRLCPHMVVARRILPNTASMP